MLSGTVGSGAVAIGAPIVTEGAITIGPRDTRLKLAAIAIEDGDLVSRHKTQDTDEVVRLV